MPPEQNTELICYTFGCLLVECQGLAHTCIRTAGRELMHFSRQSLPSAKPSGYAAVALPQGSGASAFGVSWDSKWEPDRGFAVDDDGDQNEPDHQSCDMGALASTLWRAIRHHSSWCRGYLLPLSLLVAASGSSMRMTQATSIIETRAWTDFLCCLALLDLGRFWARHKYATQPRYSTRFVVGGANW